MPPTSVAFRENICENRHKLAHLARVTTEAHRITSLHRTILSEGALGESCGDLRKNSNSTEPCTPGANKEFTLLNHASAKKI